MARQKAQLVPALPNMFLVEFGFKKNLSPFDYWITDGHSIFRRVDVVHEEMLSGLSPQMNMALCEDRLLSIFSDIKARSEQSVTIRGVAPQPTDRTLIAVLGSARAETIYVNAYRLAFLCRLLGINSIRAIAPYHSDRALSLWREDLLVGALMPLRIHDSEMLGFDLEGQEVPLP